MEHLYDSMKIQLNAINNQDKVLKSLIAFHSDSQSQKIKEWLTFFAERIHGLKKELIKLDLDTSIYKDIGELGKYVKVVEFEGETMDYSLAGKSLKSKSQQSRSQQSKSSNSSQSSLPH